MKIYDDVRAVDGGYRLAETDTHYIDAIQMLYNWRMCMTPKSCPLTYERGWCYPGRNIMTLLTIRAAVLLWDRQGGDEPIGWIKSVPDEEYREPVDVVELLDHADAEGPSREAAP